MNDEELAAYYQAGRTEEEGWEPVPAPPGTQPHRLGCRITVRLDVVLAAKLRAVAQRERAGYTSLVRQWIEERLAVEQP